MCTLEYRSTQNTRIEWLWRDYTECVGERMKGLFSDLSHQHGLNVNIPQHKWLLRFLFLPILNEDAQEFANTWNQHVMELDGQRDMSPHDLFLTGTIQNGLRGILYPQDDASGEDGNEIGRYEGEEVGLERGNGAEGVFNHAGIHNAEHLPVAAPPTFSEVVLASSNCPLSAEQLQHLTGELGHREHLKNTVSMAVCRQLWIEALEICQRMW